MKYVASRAADTVHAVDVLTHILLAANEFIPVHLGDFLSTYGTIAFYVGLIASEGDDVQLMSISTSVLLVLYL